MHDTIPAVYIMPNDDLIQTYEIIHPTLGKMVEIVIDQDGKIAVDVGDPGWLSFDEMSDFFSWIVEEVYTLLLQNNFKEEQKPQQQPSRAIPPKGPIGGRGTHNIG